MYSSPHTKQKTADGKLNAPVLIETTVVRVWEREHRSCVRTYPQLRVLGARIYTVIGALPTT